MPYRSAEEFSPEDRGWDDGFQIHLRRIHVSDVPFNHGQAEVRSCFEAFGEVTDCHISNAKEGGGRCGHVEFKDKTAARKAYQEYAGVPKRHEYKVDNFKFLPNQKSQAASHTTTTQPQPIQQAPAPRSVFEVDDSTLMLFSNVIRIFTDGSFDGPNATYGVFFGHDHPLNCSGRLSDLDFKSSTMAEIEAVRVALINLLGWQFYRDHHQTMDVLVYSDSLNVVRFLSEYDGALTLTRFEREKLGELLHFIKKDFKRGVRFVHLFGHNGRVFHDQADKIARDALQATRTGPQRMMNGLGVIVDSQTAVSSQSVAVSSQPVNDSRPYVDPRYKTKPCHNYPNCKRGTNCWFIHPTD